jgi:hypothetical protein
MVSPVEGSLKKSGTGLKWRGRSLSRVLSRSPGLLAIPAPRKMRDASRPKRTGTVDIDSTPPAMPIPARPWRMASATSTAACRLVMQLLETRYARIEAGSPRSKTISRARLEMKGRAALRPRPAGRSFPGRGQRSSSPLTACEGRQLRNAAEDRPALTKGVRMPPTMATLVSVFMEAPCF